VSPGKDLCPSVSSVVPVFTLARTNASIEAAELSGIAARRMRPDRVSRYFARFRLTLAWFVPRSITSTAPAIRIFPDFTGSKKLLSARKGISVWSTSTTPSSGSRWGSIIDRRSAVGGVWGSSDDDQQLEAGAGEACGRAVCARQ